MRDVSVCGPRAPKRAGLATSAVGPLSFPSGLLLPLRIRRPLSAITIHIFSLCPPEVWNILGIFASNGFVGSSAFEARFLGGVRFLHIPVDPELANASH